MTGKRKTLDLEAKRGIVRATTGLSYKIADLIENGDRVEAGGFSCTYVGRSREYGKCLVERDYDHQIFRYPYNQLKLIRKI